MPKEFEASLRTGERISEMMASILGVFFAKNSQSATKI